MRIAYSHHAFYLQRYGGITRYFIRLVDELYRQGVDAHIFSPLYRNKYINDLPKSTFSGLYCGVRVHKFGKYLRGYNRSIGRRGIKQWNANIVHETYYSDDSIAPKGCPTVVTVFDMIHELNPGEFPEADKVSYEKRKTVQRAEHVICISENTQKELIDIFGIDKEKTTVVYLGVDRWRSDKIVQARNSPSKQVIRKPYLLFVGNRGGYKKFSDVLRAIASSSLKREVNLLAFGGGKFTSVEKKTLAKLGFDGNEVRHVGHDDLVLGNLYRQAIALVYPSLHEGFGLPLLEAMKHSCPVISSNINELREVAGNAALYFEPTDIDGLRQAIENLATSDEERCKLIEKGKQRVRLYSWSRCGEETLSVYRRILNIHG